MLNEYIFNDQVCISITLMARIVKTLIRSLSLPIMRSTVIENQPKVINFLPQNVIQTRQNDTLMSHK